MGPGGLLLASIVAMSIFPYMLHRANSEDVFSEADGPTAESSDNLDELWLSPGPPPRVVDVDEYGARAAGGDDTQAFLGAWREACNSSEYPSMFLVPEGKTYVLMPVSFCGPCRAISITAMIRGTLEAPYNRSVWLDHNLHEWITFEGIDRLRVQGGGTLNGNGQQWWINSCKVNKSMRCVTGPTALYFRRCTHLVVEDLEVRDSMQMHVAIAYSWNVLVSKLFITAPGWSPNTDGIHVSNSKEVSIIECIISTGDDCIAIVTGSMFVRATGIFCGPGHGISIGSLGANNSRAHVSDVLVEKATLLGTTNGVRIKTWQGGHGYAERITFQDITMHNVTNPVIINQKYCDSKIPCHEQESAVAIRNIRYRNIRGTSASKVAVNFICSEAVHCDGIIMQDIYLVGEGRYATCSHTNATVAQLGYNFPFCSADM
ncbi:polygalacturonase-like [Phragmites australis]|uniref:polygalacturonase-like n=1 Tax=Phragmites australis TaxID=29695 RepID=UPI002D79360E|nr:polygalacturonase-like [Phragmites australis]